MRREVGERRLELPAGDGRVTRATVPGQREQPDRVAEELTIISQAGVRGIGLSFVNYLAEVPYFCDEILPRLQRAGVRMAH